MSRHLSPSRGLLLLLPVTVIAATACSETPLSSTDGAFVEPLPDSTVGSTAKGGDAASGALPAADPTSPDVTSPGDDGSTATCPNETLNVVAATDAGTAQSGRAIEAALDGKGFDSGDDYSRWALTGMPTDVVFDLGQIVRLCTTRFSFFRFNEGRTYDYSVAHSADGQSYTTILDHATSTSVEWTEEPVQVSATRYIKLSFHGASPTTTWAGLWEVEFLGESGSNPQPQPQPKLNSYPIIVDDGDPGTSSLGTWERSRGADPYGDSSVQSENNGDSYAYEVALPEQGEYRVYARWTSWGTRRTSVPFEIVHAGGTSTFTVNQKESRGRWSQLGDGFTFGDEATITVRSLGGGTTNADAVMLVPADAGPGLVLFHQNNDELEVADPISPSVLKQAYAMWDSDVTAERIDGSIAVVPDPLGDPARGNVLRYFVPANRYRETDIGTGPDLNSTEPELYAAFDLYVASEGRPPWGAKICGFSSYGKPRPGSGDVSGCQGDARTGWSYRLMYYTSDEEAGGGYGPASIPYGQNVVGSYHYYRNHNHYIPDTKCGKSVMGETNPTKTSTQQFGEGTLVGLNFGGWNRIQLHVKPNTVFGDGGASGITELWINGVKTISHNKIEYVPEASEQNFELEPKWSANNYYNIRRFFFHPYHGGGSPLWHAPKDVYYYVDNMAVSTAYIQD